VRVGTWNVAGAAGAAKNERRLRRILAIDADVWVLTETNDDLQLGDTFRAPADHGPRRGAMGDDLVAIFR